MAYPTTTTHPRLYPFTSIMAAPYGCDPTGVTNCSAAVEQLKADLSNSGSIHIPKGTFKIGTNLTIPVGMSFVFEIGGVLQVEAGVTLTINGFIVAGPWRIFTGAGTVVINVVNAIAYGAWTGSTGITIGDDLTFTPTVTFIMPDNPVLPGNVTFEDYGAGLLKSSALGVITAAALLESELPSAIDAAKIGSGNISNTEFEYLDGVTSNLQTQLNALIVGGAVALPYGILQNRRALGTSGGSGTLGAWRIVPLNVEYEDANAIIDSSALPQFTLGAGTFTIEALCPFYQTGLTQIRLYNVTAAGVQGNIGGYNMVSACAMMGGANTTQTIAYLLGTFTIAAPKQFQLEYRVTVTQNTTGLGRAASFSEEVFAQVRITQTA